MSSDDYILNIEDDFDLDRIAESGQCFRWTRMEEGEKPAYRIIRGGECLYIEKSGRNSYVLSCGEEEFHRIWEHYFDLEENYRAIRERIDREKDPFLWKASRQEKGIRILRQDPWEMLITFIISQNRNIPAIRRSVEMLAEAAGEEKTDRKGRSYYAFPRPKALAGMDEDGLKACRLGYRCRYVSEAAKAVASGRFNPEGLKDADEETAIRALTELCGVGVKVANCVSLFGLHHIDAFPKDVWVKRILEKEYPEGYPFDDYSPYNGIYQQYMFAYYREL